MRGCENHVVVDRRAAAAGTRAMPRAWPALARGLAALLLVLPARAQDADVDLTELSLEALMNLEVQVTSVSKKPQELHRTPAAVYVLTGEEIRRSGVNSIPEALRLVPGVHVARVWSNTWAVSTRGFNGPFTNKLLVMIDGRSVYTPLFGGVWWDVQDTLIEDIDRIEVIRGPGGAIWGANAFNGVINIITKKARDTQGTLISAEAGTQDQLLGARYGGTFGETGHWRAYVRGQDRGELHSRTGTDVDDWWHRRTGFRMDFEPRASDTFTVQGDIYDGRGNWLISEPAFTPQGTALGVNTMRENGGNLLARWSRELSAGNSVSVQTWFDRTERFTRTAGETRDTFDVEVSQHVDPDDVHDVVWGAGFRTSEAEFRTDDQFSWSPNPRTIEIWNVFVQDEITIVPDTFSLTLGSKFEHNTYTSWEVQPTARVTWTPDDDQVVWGAVSRSIRMPTGVERDGTIAVAGIPDFGLGFDTLVSLRPGRDMVAERLYAWEAGWRSQVTEDVYVDAAVYYNDFDDLLTYEPGALQPTADPTLFVLPLEAHNELEGHGRGIEVGAGWQVTSAWELAGGYSYQTLHLDAEPTSSDTNSAKAAKDLPRNIFNVRSHHQLAEQWQLDALLFYVDSLEQSGIPSYWRGDLRLGWRPHPGAEVSLGVRNLFHDHEPEGATPAGLGNHLAGNGAQTEAYLRGVFRF